VTSSCSAGTEVTTHSYGFVSNLWYWVPCWYHHHHHHHHHQLFYYFGHIILFDIELVDTYIFQIFKVHYIPSVVLLCWPYYSVRYWPSEYVYISDFQGLICSLSYVIILATLLCLVLNLETWVRFWIMRFVRGLQIFYSFSNIVKSNLNLVNKNVFQTPEFHVTPEINMKGRPNYYCLLYMIYNALI
jgi:hypothetical protein